jgi:hypothetical protein
MKCIVKDCINQTHEGQFIGGLCSPCHKFVTTGNGVYSQAYRNTRREWVGLTDAEIEEFDYYARDLVMDIEKALKEKNT